MSIPYIWVCEECGIDCSSSKSSGEYIFIDEFGDFINVIRRKCTFSQWMKDMKHAKVFKYYYRCDNKPTINIALKMIAITVKHGLLNKEK